MRALFRGCHAALGPARPGPGVAVGVGWAGASGRGAGRSGGRGGARAGGLRWVWAAAVTVPVADNGRLSESGVRVVRPELSGVLGPGAVRVRVGRGAPGYLRPPTPPCRSPRDVTGSAGLTGRDGGIFWRALRRWVRVGAQGRTHAERDGRTRAFCTHL